MSTKASPPAKPVLSDTLYDRVSSWSIALFVAVAGLCFCVVVAWFTSRLPTPPHAVPVELVESPGGFEDGSPDETLRVDSPEPENRDASLAEVISEKTEIAASVETIVEVSDSASESVQGPSLQQQQQQFDTGVAAINAGKLGSARGTGKRGLGIGPGTGGMPREQRWFVRFGERAGVDEYAKQLQFFGIEVGALLQDGRLAYLSNLTQPVPTVKYVASGANEKRLYMTWQGGDRRSADVDLFKRAGVDVFSDTPIFHFYPPATESQLVRLEVDYRNRKVSQIRRTYFEVVSAQNGYHFVVIRQVYLQ